MTKEIVEEWRPVKEYEGCYEVSNIGRVRSLDRVVIGKDGKKRFYKGQILIPGKDKDGYLLVNLHSNGKGKTKFIHHLVVEAFIPNPDNLEFINHKDEVKTNNVVTNLEYCTNEYNLNYGTRNKRIAEKLSKQVYQYTLDNELVAIWSSTRECQRNGYSSGNISLCCSGKLKTYKNFIWRYKEQ